MILEAVILNVIPSQTEAFETNFRLASEFITKAKGYITHELQKCMEVENKYLLLIKWETLEDHTIGFRNSAEYLEWKKLLHHFYDPHPIVEHFTKVY
jgi:heme-degrading monooxygenase HmoA